ncbi:hypothetical protein PP766_gp43 [Escherichia phage U1G]|uniref:Uncharacterized protein n=1 Tax=Escherichia phage U1G TaxID=2853091 RepID=A0AAE7SUZ2_9CAUD|nr:hypothetical protein PP766_gp43 [Escherichia phage U1G]QXV71876.1 hypothetical protein [Escherichia phage U1G]
MLDELYANSEDAYDILHNAIAALTELSDLMKKMTKRYMHRTAIV